MNFIVIPVYNSDKTLFNCVSSIPQRNDVQIVISYDKSSDDSWKIIETILSQRSDIYVVKCCKHTAGATRNVALKYIYGKKLDANDSILFLDSDDYFDEKINKILSHKNTSDLSIYAHNTQRKNFNEYKIKRSELIERSIGARNSNFMGTTYRFNSVWGKVFSATTLKRNKILFDENIKIAEDLIFLLEFVQYINVVKIIPCNMYFYHKNFNSLTHEFHDDFLQNDMKVQEKCMNLVDSKYRTLFILKGIMNIFGLQVFSMKSTYNFHDKKKILNIIKKQSIYKYTLIDIFKNVLSLKSSQIIMLILFKIRLYRLLEIFY